MSDPRWRHTGLVQAEYGCFWIEPHRIPPRLQQTFDGDLLFHQGDGRISVLTGIQYGRVRVTVELWPQAPTVSASEWEEHESLTVDWPPECEAIRLNVDNEGGMIGIPIALGPTGVAVWCRNRDRAAELDQSGAPAHDVDGVAEFLVAIHRGDYRG